MTTQIVTQPAELGTCPACGKPLAATATYEMAPPDLAAFSVADAPPNVGREVTAALTLTGLRIDHDCRPKTTRSSRGATAP